MIQLERIHKTFFVARGIFQPARPLTALNGVSLATGPGEIMAVLGPNGAGKSTLLKIICGLVTADSGMVTVKGTLGWLSGESDGFYPQLTAKQNLDFFASLYRVPQQKFDQRVAQYIRSLDLKDLDKPLWQYSSGIRRRLAILRILALDQGLILLDEPTKSLDPIACEKLHAIIKRLAKELNKTVIIATHNLKEAQTLADCLAILDNGRLIYYGKSADDCRNTETIYKQLLTKNEE
jgi:ABC-2 type transport system ATP-binding protein